MKRAFLTSLVAATMFAFCPSSSFADCTDAYVKNTLKQITKLEKAVDNYTRKVERLEVQREASRNKMEQKIDNIEARRLAAYTNLTNVKAALNGVSAIINCVLNPSQCANETQRLQNLVNAINRTIEKYETTLDRMRDTRDRNDNLYVHKIEIAQNSVNTKTAALVTLNSNFDICKVLRVINPEAGATVNSPVLVKSKVVATTLAPLGDSRPNRSVLGIVVDGNPVAVGNSFPINQSGFILLDGGESQTTIPLSPGAHGVVVQVLDSLGVVRGDFDAVSRQFNVN